MITNSLYRDIMSDYDRIQTKNRHLLEQRKEEIHAKFPLYKELDQSVSALCLMQGRKMLAGDTAALAQMKQELRSIVEQKKSILKDNGYRDDYLDPIYDCSDCQDTGYLKDNQRCHCLKSRISGALSELSGLSKLIKTENFDHLSTEYYEGEDLSRFEITVQKAKKFVSDFSSDYHNLLFYGTVGTGKSFLSCCIAKELLDEGYQVLYFSSRTLFDKIAEYTFSAKDKEALSQFYENLYGCDLLIIDDLGTEIVNSFVSSELFSCVNERHCQKRATIINSNISLEELSTHYSERLFSRITSNFELLKFTGKDIRMYKKRLANRK